MVIAGVSWMFIFQDTTLRNKVFLHQSLSSFTLFKNAEMTWKKWKTDGFWSGTSLNSFENS